MTHEEFARLLRRIGSRIDCDKLLDFPDEKGKKIGENFCSVSMLIWVAQVVYSRSVIQHVSDCVRRPTMNLFIQIVSGEFQSAMSQAQSFDLICLDAN